ncbi:MAG: sensor histidine kinase [Actinomycetota bacterium]
MASLAVPSLFTSTFLIAVSSLGVLWVSLTRPRFAPAPSAARGAFGAGWLALGVAEILQGSLVLTGDPNVYASSLRLAAYALIALGLLGTLGARRAARSAVPLSAPLAASAGLALAGSVLALLGGLPGRRRLSVALGLLAVSEALLAVPASSMGGSDVAGMGISLLRLAAAAWLVAWLWQAFQESIQVRFVGAFVVLLLMVIVAIGSTISQVVATNVRRDALERAGEQGVQIVETMRRAVNESVQRAKLLAGLQLVQQAAATRPDQLATIATDLQKPAGVFADADFIAFFDQAGRIAGYSAQGPSGPGLDDAEIVSLAGTSAVQGALKIESVGSIESLGGRKVAVIGAAQIGPVPLPAGVVAVGQLVDAGYLNEVKSGERQMITLLSLQGVLATTADPPGAAGALLARREDEIRGVFEQGVEQKAQVSVAGDLFFTAYVPVRDQADQPVVAALAVSQPAGFIAGTQENLTRTLFLLALAATVIAVAASSVSGSRITRPIRELTAAAERVRHGDLNARVDVRGADEVGALGAAFNEMTVGLNRLTGDLRTAAEEESRLRSQLEAVLQSMADGVVAVDPGGRVVAFNREAERIFGVGAEQVLGQNVRAVVSAVDAAGSRLDLPIYGLAAGSVRGFVSGDGRNGSPVPVAMTAAPIVNDRGSVTGAVTVVRDLTRELEVERMKTEFLSNISHELRTPLTPIKGYADLMRRKPVSREKAVSFLDGILASTERLERIVEMLVDFAAMEGGRLVPRRVPVDVQHVVEELVAHWRTLAPQHRFELEGFGELPPLNVDERLLPRAIGELIDNAVKFSPTGGIVLLSAEVGRSRRDDVRISVTDQGIGISANEQEHIFQDFVQVDASETRPFGGLGLGLAYVRRIVEEHGGRLEVSSAPDKGSTFTVVLPGSVVAPEGTRSAPRPMSGAPERPSDGTARAAAVTKAGQPATGRQKRRERPTPRPARKRSSPTRDGPIEKK